jgi:hypothetical protein
MSMFTPVQLPKKLRRLASEFSTPVEFVEWFTEINDKIVEAGAPPAVLLAFCEQYTAVPDDIGPGSYEDMFAEALTNHWWAVR